MENVIMKKLTLLFLLISVNLYALNESEIRETYSKSFNYEKIQNYTDAIKSMMTVYQEYPKAYTVNLRLGWLYYLNGNYANSLRHYDNAVSIMPFSLEAKSGRLLPLLAQEKYSEVENKAFDILNVDFYNYYGNLRLCYALRKQKKFDIAEKIASKMLAVYPTDITLLTEYALVKIGKESIEDAGKVLYNIQILDPENVIAKDFFLKQ